MRLFCKEDCKFDTYKNIIRDVKESGKYMDYPDAKTSEAFVVLRHDIEFFYRPRVCVVGIGSQK